MSAFALLGRNHRQIARRRQCASRAVLRANILKRGLDERHTEDTVARIGRSMIEVKINEAVEIFTGGFRRSEDSICKTRFKSPSDRPLI